MSQKDNRKRWVEALRSGEYMQAQEVLCDGKGGYCCLGVLCEVYEGETGEVLPKIEDGRYDVTDESLGNLEQVREWVGLRNPEGFFKRVEGVPYTSLTLLNDESRWDFHKLADFIESEPEGLFR